MQVETGEGRDGRGVVEGRTEEREVLGGFGLLGEGEGRDGRFLARLAVVVGRGCFVGRGGVVVGEMGGLARAVAVGRGAGVGFGGAQGDGAAQSLHAVAQGQDAAVSLVLVQALPPVPFAVPVPVQLGEECVRGGGVGRRDLGVVVGFFRHEGGQAGGGVEAEDGGGGRRRGQASGRVEGVGGVSSETTKDAVWHACLQRARQGRARKPRCPTWRRRRRKRRLARMFAVGSPWSREVGSEYSIRILLVIYGGQGIYNDMRITMLLLS